MSFSTAFQSLRHTAARSVANGQLSSVASSSRSCHTKGFWRKATHRPHAPHGLVELGVAGPSRCFCDSRRLAKASELPLEELRYETSLDSYSNGQPSNSSDFWHHSDLPRPHLQPARQSQATHDHRKRPSPSIRALFDHNSERPLPDSTSPADFFTSSSPRQKRHSLAKTEPPPVALHTPTSAAPPLRYIDSLAPPQREALEKRIRLLIRSGERSMVALCAELGDVDIYDKEQICCHILSQCIKESQDPRLVWDICRSWTPTQLANDSDSGPTRNMVRRMQGDTIYKCVNYLQAAGLTRQAAIIIGDRRLRPSQSRYLLERLIFDVKLPTASIAAQQSSDSFDVAATPSSQVAVIQRSPISSAAADARLVVREICDAMTSLMADGVSFKRKVVNRALKLLCLTRARSRVVRLLRAAQRRAQIELNADASDELRTAGGFSRLRAEEAKSPQVVSTKVMEEALRALCAQDQAGARTAHELLSALDVSQRTAAMYDALMTVYGNAPCTPSTVADPSTGELTPAYMSVDEQLWLDICTLPHLGGPTVHTLSARIVCHARTRRLDLIKSDLDFLRRTHLGTLHDLTENARLAVVRCSIERGCLLTGFRYASILLTPTLTSRQRRFQSQITTTLLRAAQHISIPPSHGPSPSRAQLLKRFLRHFSHLHRKFPQVQPGLEQLRLVIELLDRQQGWLETRTVWSMVRMVGRHFGEGDERLARVLQAFVRVFEARGEEECARELGGLVGRLKAKQRMQQEKQT